MRYYVYLSEYCVMCDVMWWVWYVKDTMEIEQVQSRGKKDQSILQLKLTKVAISMGKAGW